MGIASPAIIYTNLKENVVAGLHTIPLGVNDSSSLFYYYVFQTSRFKEHGYKYGTGVKVFGITYDNISKFPMIVPRENKEKQSISDLIFNIEKLITLEQEKHERLEDLKQELLSMFFEQKKYKNHLRLNGFDSLWKKGKLSSVVKRITRKNTENITDVPLTISSQFGLIPQNQYYEKQVASSDLSHYILLKKGEFAYNKSYSNNYPFGAIKRLDNYESGALSTLYIAFKPTDINSNFLKYYFESNSWHKEIARTATEGARNHGLLNVSPKDFFSIEIYYPGNHVEQARIGNIFEYLDKLILAQYNQVKQLEQVKATLLRQMFV